MSHLDALNLSLSHERSRLANAPTEAERRLRAVWVAQLEREVAAEQKFIGECAPAPDMTDAELLRELES